MSIIASIEVDIARMASGYIEAALWADCLPLRGEEAGGLTHLRLTDDNYQQCIAYCSMFYLNNREACDTYINTITDKFGAWSMLGHDLRMMQGGHGVGPEDRSGITQDVALTLRKAAGYGSPECYQMDAYSAEIDFGRSGHE